MIEQTPQPLGLTCRVFKAQTLEAALTEAAAKGYKTDDGYWWANHLYLPVGSPLAKTIKVYTGEPVHYTGEQLKGWLE